MTLDGVIYPDGELDLANALCGMEELGIDILGMLSGQTEMKTFTMLRGLVSL